MNVNPNHFSKILFVLIVLLVAGPHAWAAFGYSMIQSTHDTSLSGMVALIETDGGLQVDVKLAYAPPGKHGVHIHENGDCSDRGKAAGGHFNPEHTNHGFTPNDGVHNAHVGDMGNIEVDAQGIGQLSVFLPGVSLKGKEPSVAGLSIIVHEKEDDFSQPTGNAGGRIGCGIIEMVQESPDKTNTK